MSSPWSPGLGSGPDLSRVEGHVDQIVERGKATVVVGAAVGEIFELCSCSGQVEGAAELREAAEGDREHAVRLESHNECNRSYRRGCPVPQAHAGRNFQK